MRKEPASHLAFTGLIAAACFMVTVLVGLSDTMANDPASKPDPNALPQALEELMKNPDTIPAAETVFYQNCAYCHGSKGSGGKSRPLQCRDFEPQHLFDTITNGRRRGAAIMPPWKGSMSDDERWELVAYIMSLKDLPNCKK